MIITQELVRVGARGYGDGMLGGMVIGLPPVSEISAGSSFKLRRYQVMNFGGEELRKKVMSEVLSGKKFICLAISEG